MIRTKRISHQKYRKQCKKTDKPDTDEKSCKDKAKAKQRSDQQVKVNSTITVKTGAVLKNSIGCNLNTIRWAGKAPIVNNEDCEDQMGPQSMTTAHLCAIDRDCEDFEGPILALEQPISAIVHTKPT
ncbi:hypothetical protein Tco_0504566 [Tanacetum coccineum]